MWLVCWKDKKNQGGFLTSFFSILICVGGIPLQVKDIRFNDRFFTYKWQNQGQTITSDYHFNYQSMNAIT